MKKKIVSAILAGSMLIGVASCSKPAPSESQEPSESESVTETSEETEPTEDPDSIMGFNMIENGDFASAEHTWGTYFEGGDGVLAVNDKGELQFDSKMIGAVNWANQIYYDGFSLYKDCVYVMSFDCYATIDRDVEYRIQINGGDYHAYNIDTIHVTTEVQHFEYTFTMEEESDPAPRLCFNMGKFDGLDNVAHSVMFDNIDLRCIDDSGYVPGAGFGPQAAAINLNQIGYLPTGYKIAVFHGDAIADKATVVDVATGSGYCC